MTLECNMGPAFLFKSFLQLILWNINFSQILTVLQQKTRRKWVKMTISNIFDKKCKNRFVGPLYGKPHFKMCRGGPNWLWNAIWHPRFGLKAFYSSFCETSLFLRFWPFYSRKHAGNQRKSCLFLPLNELYSQMNASYAFSHPGIEKNTPKLTYN